MPLRCYPLDLTQNIPNYSSQITINQARSLLASNFHLDLELMPDQLLQSEEPQKPSDGYLRQKALCESSPAPSSNPTSAPTAPAPAGSCPDGYYMTYYGYCCMDGTVAVGAGSCQVR